MKRRTLIQLATGAAASAALPATFAQSYPSKQIRFVVPFPAGGTPEALTRLIVNERKKFADVIKRAGIKPE